jgi:hypothetical protein
VIGIKILIGHSSREHVKINQNLFYHEALFGDLIEKCLVFL